MAAAGRAAQDFFRDAERHLRDALALQPAATELAYTLVQARRWLTTPKPSSSALLGAGLTLQEALCMVGVGLRLHQRERWR